MLSMYNIWSVAVYESKTLLRSWFFRIFAILALLFIGGWNVLAFSRAVPDIPWIFRALPAFIPLLNMSWLNLVQAVLAIFLSTEFLKRDKKMDTTEVIYMRSMTNGDYVFGKMLGIMMVFISLNLLLLLIGGIINGVFSDRPMFWFAYLFYPLVLSLPTLIFTFGLAFLLMLLVRNQAVTFVLLLGYAALVLIYLRDNYSGLFDYLGFYVPLTLSDFVPLPNLGLVLMQRGLYVILGMACMFGTVLLLPRLPQSPGLRNVAVSVVAVSLIISAFLVFHIYSYSAYGQHLRTEMRELNKEAARSPHLTLLRSSLELEHQGAVIQVRDQLVLSNPNTQQVGHVTLSLNPGFTVSAIEQHNQSLTFVRKAHLLTITLAAPLASGSKDSITVHYRGAPDDRACYTDASEEKLSQRQRIWNFTAGKKYSFVTPGYVLLTPESQWYPVSGVPYGSTFPSASYRDFTQFVLRVKTKAGLKALSQGVMEEPSSGQFLFKPETPLAQLSLVIGQYQQMSVQAGDVTYALYCRPGHDYFKPYFKDMKDTLAVVIRDMKQDYERRHGLSFPYKRFNLVEVPIQFVAYDRLWTMQTEYVQPEFVYYPEFGVGLNGAEIPERASRMQRMERQMNQVLTPQEQQTRMFRNAVESGLLGNRMDRSFRENWTSLPANCNIFPMYYTTANYFYSPSSPLFNVACESYLFTKSYDQLSRQTPFRMFVGISDEEKASLALADHTLPEILADKEQQSIAGNVLRLKGEYLFRNIESKVGSEVFPKLMAGYLGARRFQELNLQDFAQTLKEQYQFDLSAEYELWQNSRQLPGYLLNDVQAYKVLDKDRTRYQVRFKIANPEPVPGLIAVNFRRGGPGGPGGPPPGGFGMRGFGMGRGTAEPDRLYRVAAGESKEIGVVLDDQPQILQVNTLVSRNLPTILTQPLGEIKMREKAVPFSGEQPVAIDKSTNEIIVDNEDAGFSFVSQQSSSWLKRMLPSRLEQKEDKYKGLSWWSPPQTWTLTSLSDFYGHYIHSASYIRSGKGEKTATWTAQIPASGQYDVFFYVARIPTFFRERREGRRGQNMVGTFHLVVKHDDGDEKVTLDADKAETGWYLLCTHYFSTGSAQVSITDESNGRVVYADAVKWVKR